jgi:hypothetical protein
MTMGDVYERLADFLDRMPAGYPKTEDGRGVDLLRQLECMVGKGKV